MMLEVAIMPDLRETHSTELNRQHSLQSQDFLKILTLANAEGLDDGIDTYSFEEFLGLTIHLLVTTQSQYTREQLALQLPKFGSAVVLPLIKILCRMSSRHDLQRLAQQSLDRMGLYALILGLNQMLDGESDNDVRIVAIQTLIELTQVHDQSVLMALPKLVSERTWQLLKQHLLAQFPYPTFNNANFNNSSCIKLGLVPSTTVVDICV